MNIISHLGGITAAREILDKAPKGEGVYLKFYDPEINYFVKSSEYLDEPAMILDGNHWTGVDDGYPQNRRLDYEPYISVDALRIAIAEQDRKTASFDASKEERYQFTEDEYQQAVSVVRKHKNGSCSHLQREMGGWPYMKAAGCIDRMEAKKIVSSMDDVGHRDVYIWPDGFVLVPEIEATVAEECEPEDELTRIGYMIEKAAKELPDGYLLNISISKEAGVVKVELPNGEEIGDFGNADGFSYEIQEALATAIWHAEKDNGHD